MVTHLCCHWRVTRTKAGRRKLRLFGCACCRRVAHLFPDEPWWPVVDLAERLADGAAIQSEVDAAFGDPELVLHDGEGDQARQARGNLHKAVRKLGGPAAAAAIACSSVGIALRWLRAGEAAECAVQAGLLRDLFGNPFRPATVEPRWRTPAVVALAQQAYEVRVASDPSRPGWLMLDVARLFALADALEDAGADEPGILEHLRAPGGHVRGCWCLDLLLRKS
jgi:hypothetical protein